MNLHLYDVLISLYLKMEPTRNIEYFPFFYEQEKVDCCIHLSDSSTRSSVQISACLLGLNNNFFCSANSVKSPKIT